jgi:hypothetical protein
MYHLSDLWYPSNIDGDHTMISSLRFHRDNVDILVIVLNFDFFWSPGTVPEASGDTYPEGPACLEVDGSFLWQISLDQHQIEYLY